MENQIVIVVTEEQYHIIVNALNDLRTKCIAENIDTKDINELLLLIIDSPVKGFVKNNNIEQSR